MNQEKAEKIKKGVKKYEDIMKTYRDVDVATDRVFQKLYNGFYRIRQRPEHWYAHYYLMLEGLKNINMSFDDILKKLYQKTRRVEASFASKMFATQNPEYPLIDKWVLRHFGIILPGTNMNNRINIIIEKYKCLITCFEYLKSTDEGAKYIEEFDKICPDVHISDVKKIDFMLWQER